MAEWRKWSAQHDTSLSQYEGKRVCDPPGFDPAAAREVRCFGRRGQRLVCWARLHLPACECRCKDSSQCSSSCCSAHRPRTQPALSPSHQPPQGEGSGATGRGGSRLPLQKRQELLQQQATAPLKQVWRLAGGAAE